MTAADGTKKRRRDTRQRNRIIAVRCTDEEFAAIHGLAERSGRYAATYLRLMALNTPGPRAPQRPRGDQRELARLLGELGRVGNNLNQIARALHQGDQPPLDELKQALTDLSAMRADARRALGLKEAPTDGD